MIEIETNLAQYRPLFENYGPNQPVIDSIFAGHNPGRLWVDLKDPSQSALLTTQYGFVFGWGKELGDLIRQRATEMGKTLTFIPKPHWKEEIGTPVNRLEFFGPNDVTKLDTLSKLPNDFEFVEINSKNYEKSNWKDAILQLFSDSLMFEKSGGGIALTNGNCFIAEALIGFVGSKLVEIGTVTHPLHRGSGYSTIVCAELIKRIQERGLEAYWSCNAENKGSAKIAEKLGFQHCKPYTVFWIKPDKTSE